MTKPELTLALLSLEALLEKGEHEKALEVIRKTLQEAKSK